MIVAEDLFEQQQLTRMHAVVLLLMIAMTALDTL
jgi:hypothetical protein